MNCLVILLLTISVASAEDVTNQEFAKANNLFVPCAYKGTLEQHNKNFLVSPFSAETALAFVQAGCKGESAQELRNALHLPDDKNEIESNIKTLLPKLTGNDQYTLHTANKMYVKKNFKINDEFKKTASEIFHADSENIDFEKNNEAARTMNNWVEKHTQNTIHNLVDSNDLDEYTRAVLINALYFKSNWSQPFGLTLSKKRDFYKTSNDVIQVDTMYHHFKHFNYFECHHLNAQFLELPFQGEDASMVIILPNEKEGLATLEKQIERVFTPHNLTVHLVNVALPRFKIESQIDFKKILKNLGVSKVFEKEDADLSGIAGKKGDLIIDKVVQKAFIDVNEEGVEAAAATHVAIAVPTSASRTPLKQFRADHPFIFYIKIKGLIIFAGRVSDPSL